MDSSRLLQSLTVLGKKLFLYNYACLAKLSFKASRVVSRKLRYNGLVLVAVDGPWSSRSLVPDRGDVV